MMSKTIGIAESKLYLGDCMEELPSISDASVDMILCDLPYGTTACAWDSIIPLDALWKQYKRIAKENAAIVLTAQTPFDKVLGMSNVEELRYEWVWIKSVATGALNAKKMPLKKHENILVFYRKLPTYNPQLDFGTPYERHRKARSREISVYGKTGENDAFHSVNTGRRLPTSELQFNSHRDFLHPTQKPIALMEYLIKTYTNAGELVLDNTMGSGTTGVAALQCGRRFIGIENDKKYFAIAEERIRHATAEQRLF